jgi:hypothetical protein
MFHYFKKEDKMDWENIIIMLGQSLFNVIGLVAIVYIAFLFSGTAISRALYERLKEFGPFKFYPRDRDERKAEEIAKKQIESEKKAQVVELDTLEVKSEVEDTKAITGMDWDKVGTLFWLGNDLMWIQDMILRDAPPKRLLQGLRHARQYSRDIDLGEKSFPCQELDLLISQVESIEGLRDYSMYRNLYNHILSRIEAIKWYFTAKAQEKQPGFEKLRAL